MPTILAPGIRYCVAGGRVVLMSLDTGRFFALPRRSEAAFAAFASGDSLALDDDDRAFLVAKGVMIEATRAITACAPIQVERVDLMSEPVRPSPPGMGLRAAGIVEQIKSDIFLRTRPFKKVVARLAKRKHRECARAHDDNEYARIDAAIRASDLILPSGNRCLARSMAFMSVSLARGFCPTLVIGVRSNPFRAHAWVQAGPRVIHDDLHQSHLFTPIFAI